jgi:hypothetical protein
MGPNERKNHAKSRVTLPLDYKPPNTQKKREWVEEGWALKKK